MLIWSVNVVPGVLQRTDCPVVKTTLLAFVALAIGPKKTHIVAAPLFCTVQLCRFVAT